MYIPPQRFIDSTRFLRDEVDMQPIVDPDSVVEVANLYSDLSIEEIVEQTDLELPENRSPKEMQKVIDTYK